MRQLRFGEGGGGSEVSINGNAEGLLSQRFLLGELFFLFRIRAVKVDLQLLAAQGLYLSS